MSHTLENVVRPCVQKKLWHPYMELLIAGVVALAGYRMAAARGGMRAHRDIPRYAPMRGTGREVGDGSEGASDTRRFDAEGTHGEDA